MHRHPIAWTLLPATLALGACADAPLASTAQEPEAITANSAQLWTGAPVIIPVCWENPSAACLGTTCTETVRARRRDVARAAVEATWMRYGRVNFTGWGACAPSQSGLHLQIADAEPKANGYFASTAAGPRWRSGRYLSGVTNGVTLNLQWNAWGPAGCRDAESSRDHCTRATAVRAFGEALGFWAEESRPSYNPGGVLAPVDRNGNGFADHLESACARVSADLNGDGVTDNSAPRYYGAYDVRSVMSRCGQTTVDTWKERLSPNDVASLQRAYGRRIAGQLVSLRGRCATASSYVAGVSGSRASLATCDEAYDRQEWFRGAPTGADLSPLRVRPNATGGVEACLGAATSLGTTGTLPVDLRACDAQPTYGQTFRSAAVDVRGMGGLCLQTRSTSVNTPAEVFLASCFSEVNTSTTLPEQRWAPTEFDTPSGTFALDLQMFNGVVGLVIEGAERAGAPVKLGYRHTATQLAFRFTRDGTLRHRAPSGAEWCVTAGPTDAVFTAGAMSPTEGATLRLEACAPGDLSQQWNLSGRLFHGVSGASTGNACLARENGQDADGTTLVAEVCDLHESSSAFPAQRWDYYFP